MHDIPQHGNDNGRSVEVPECDFRGPEKFANRWYCLHDDGAPREDGTAHFRQCQVCKRNKAKQFRGAGDVIEWALYKSRITRLLSAKPCKCGARKKWINKLLPFRFRQ